MAPLEMATVCRRPSSQTVIYGGDLNMRDSELAAVGGLPPGLRDCWQTCGRRKEAEFTWDMTRW
jgi:tyrosyl-DNA phosphodiesterase 2